ncbi:MAG: hypothetical protein ACI9QQ_001247, partial [Myxococcota bacterium]
VLQLRTFVGQTSRQWFRDPPSLSPHTHRHINLLAHWFTELSMNSSLVAWIVDRKLRRMSEVEKTFFNALA